MLGLPAWPKVDFEKFGPVTRQPLSRIGKFAGPALARNSMLIPHVCNFDKADVTELEEFRKTLNAEAKPEDTKLSINYKKKINFDILKQVDTCTESTGLIYATINCRQILDTDLLQVADSYEFEKYVVITEQCRSIPDDRFEFTVPPLQDMFSRFNTYIYTPTRGMFDGSPRLPAECKHYDRDVIYHNIDNDYLDHDTGLKNRMLDIESDFDSIRLSESDDIINILEAT